MRRHDVTESTDPRLDPFRALTDSALRRSWEAEHGLYIAESLPVLERALSAGHRPHAILAQEKWIDRIAGLLPEDTSVFVVSAETAAELTGFSVHRGVMGAMRRPSERPVSEMLAGARRVIVLEDVSDATNVGAIFRNAAAFGADAVLVTPRCSDPLYRRSVRVSMGTVFQVPWTRTGEWAALAEDLRTAGFSTVALALCDDAVSLREFRAPERIALVFGSEGDGLSAAALEHADTVVRIPMRHGVDSLNVAATTAVALWSLVD